MRTKAAAAVLAVALAVGVLAAPSSADPVPLGGPSPATFALPGRALRIAVDPAGERVYIATPGALLVRHADGSAATSVAVPDLADVVATSDEIYLLTRHAPRGGQVIVLDAHTLEQEQVRTWDDGQSSWDADLTKAPHLVVSRGALWWTDVRKQWDFVCYADSGECLPKLWRMELSGTPTRIYGNGPYVDLLAADHVIAASTDRLRQLAPGNYWPSGVVNALTGTTDVALAADGQSVVGVQPSGPSIGLKLRTSDFLSAAISYTPTAPANAVEVAGNGAVALAGRSIDLFGPGGGPPTSSYPLPDDGVVAPDLIRFSPDSSALYAAVSDSGGERLLVLDVVTPDLGPFADVPSFTTQQYADAVGRTPAAAELAAVQAALAGGARPGAVIAPLVAAESAANPVRASIIRLYQAAFLRPPDRAGLEYWVRRYQGGTKLTVIAASFAGSSEFTRRYGALSNADFVKQIFRNVFGRTVDPGGLAYWTGRLDAGRSRGVALAQWSESSEHVRKMAGLVEVTSLYLVMLDRMPTAQEWADAKAALAGGTTLADGADGMLRSSAYATRIGG